MSQGLESVSLEQLYQVIPLLAYVPQEGLQQAQEQAAASDSMMGEQVGVTLARLFYEELGMDTAAIPKPVHLEQGPADAGRGLAGRHRHGAGGLFLRADGRRRGPPAAPRFVRQGWRKFSNGEFDRFSTASLITRTTNDVQQIQMLVTMGVRMICYTPIIGIGGVIFAVQKSVSLSFLVALAVVVFLGLILVSLAVVLPKFKILQKLIDKLNLVSRENLSGMMVVRAFGNEGYEERRF